MVRSGFNWLDIGNWDEYVKVYSKNNSKVFIASEDKITGDSCYVDSDIPVALAGVEDLIVVIRSGKDGVPAAALITKKGHTQKVRHVVEQIKKEGSLELL
jgi:mannose-1-phosphate guanylyltransferase/mannose-1-phosphate guanylyltransferase/mannose-6-phosphate isomerase